ncbi:DUF1287 domain-containing protein [Tenacibaculum sp. FZY0031]|uniref:DUF1287 domain-containing protein n=1 Tax=Tenacibaculum sp. FZY0031 TaxID=3116648 RepID=UPI002EA7C5B7|nr:DUF1287 domain-containing protein [Tenacibaculum sp. FZY0031]
MKIKFLLFLSFFAYSYSLVAQENKLSTAALELTKNKVTYDSSYFSIPYPKGDVPEDKGVCTDVIIRAYRKLGVDLQQEVHKDMKANFSLYPKIWGLKNTDTNIDHRRVPNLMTFFKRKGTIKKTTKNPNNYLPGGGGLTHIGIVSSKKSPTNNQQYLIVHNIGAGQVLEDCLFNFKIIGHYSYKNK